MLRVSNINYKPCTGQTNWEASIYIKNVFKLSDYVAHLTWIPINATFSKEKHK